MNSKTEAGADVLAPWNAMADSIANRRDECLEKGQRLAADMYRDLLSGHQSSSAAVAALIARNAELEAERKAHMSADDVLSAIEDSAICLENWGELHEARDLRRAAYTLIADRDALATENKALREAVEKAYAFLTHKDWGNWNYMEGSEIYSDIREHANLLNVALARTAAKENDDG